MKITKIRLTKDASNRLRFLAGKTGVGPNLLCRIGFCLSLSEPKSPNPKDFAEEDREFNRYTLLGEFDALFIALLKQRIHQDGLSPRDLAGHFRAHMNRGISLLQQRVRNVADLANILPGTPVVPSSDDSALNGINERHPSRGRRFPASRSK